MCQYWKKLHTCTHLSDRPYIEMYDPEPRKSHFPCWPCIRNESRADNEALARANMAAQEVKEAAAKAKQAAEARMREERVRREYREKAAKEREEDAKRKEEREREMEKVKKEGGLWIETGGKKMKGRKGPLTPATPLIPSPAIKTILTRDKKENPAGAGAGGKMSPAKKSPAKISPAKEKSIESSGRAGVWGPKKNVSSVPKKENSGVGQRI